MNDKLTIRLDFDKATRERLLRQLREVGPLLTDAPPANELPQRIGHLVELQPTLAAMSEAILLRHAPLLFAILELDELIRLRMAELRQLSGADEGRILRAVGLPLPVLDRATLGAAAEDGTLDLLRSNAKEVERRLRFTKQHLAYYGDLPNP